MIDLLNDLTEIHFDLFWDKWQELKPSICSRELSEKEWFYMSEPNRIEAFTALARIHPMLQICGEPYQFLQHFSLPL